MSAPGGWYVRPLVFVADVPAARSFYVGTLGFAESWRYAEEDRVLIIQVARQGCELILTEQWPDKAGSAVIFVSIGEAQVMALAAEFEAAGARVEDGRWGYPMKVVEDPDGNQLWFALPAD
jgi:catechol 2,3-dioxygenase-like lactoylglutathione lyase family enzyme